MTAVARITRLAFIYREAALVLSSEVELVLVIKGVVMDFQLLEGVDEEGADQDPRVAIGKT